MKTSKKTIVAPAPGMTGLAVEPWAPGEIYAVAADWRQASAPVLVYGDSGWTNDEHGRQVADFRHRERDALESIIREAIAHGGDEPDDAEVEAILDDATEVLTAELGAMVAVLDSHGERYTGNNATDEAQDWLDHAFSADQADGWCEAGFWDAATAAAVRDEGLTAQDASNAADTMIEEAADEAADKYTDGSPIYAVCNNDLSVDEIIAVARRQR